MEHARGGDAVRLELVMQPDAGPGGAGEELDHGPGSPEYGGIRDVADRCNGIVDDDCSMNQL
jgi:hypothetical protein